MKPSIPYIIPVIIMAILTSCTQNDYTTITNPGFNQPEISITLPVSGDTLQGLVAILVQASDSAVISHVEFYIDGVLPDSMAADSSAPYEYLWNTENYAEGNHLISARAWTPEGNYGDAAPLLVLVDNINENGPPEISITLPVSGDTLQGLVAILVQASDSAVISHVEFYIDGVLPDSMAADSSAPYEYLWNTENYTDGNHLISARAWTPEGNYGDAVPLLVLVDNINENAPRSLRVPSQYPTVQQGVNAANDGDTVLVEPGIYHEDFSYRGKGIWVKSEMGPAETVWNGINSSIFLYFNSGEDANSVLCGFKVEGGYNGIMIDINCSPTIINCIIKDMGYTGIITSLTNSNIYNNTIYNCQYGMQVVGVSFVKNNIVVSGSQIGLWSATYDPQYRPIGDYNDIWDWGESYYGNDWNPGEHDMHLNPLFEDTISFRLSSASPCKNAGDPSLSNPDGTRSDIGAWGGPHAYP